jgi:hypothetical protein
MNIQQRQQRYGALWGAMAFVAGVGIVWFFLTPGSEGDPDRVRRAVWLFLSGHYYQAGPLKVAAITDLYPRLALLTSGSRPDVWYVLPVFISAFGSVAVNIRVGRTRNHRKILTNSAHLALGYLPVSVSAIVWSNATPEISMIVLVIAFGILALFIGSTVAGRAVNGIPVVILTSLWGLLALGVILLITGWVLLRLLVPIGVSLALGAGIGSAIVYAARNY